MIITEHDKKYYTYILLNNPVLNFYANFRGKRNTNNKQLKKKNIKFITSYSNN